MREFKIEQVKILWFLLYELTPEELFIEHAQHESFEKAIKEWRDNKPDLLDEFYKKRKEYNKPLTKKKVIGWFKD